MTNCNKFRGALRAIFAAVMLAAMAFAGCTEVDDTLGSNMVPGSQEMKAGFRSLGGRLKDGGLNPKQYFETRLFLTDSIVSSNVYQGSSTYGYFGRTKNDTLGLRSAGFLTQYTPYLSIDSGYFGFRPIFDSMQLMFSVEAWNGDTLEVQTFNVYEVVSDKFLTDKTDTTFYPSFDPEATGTIGQQPLFTFTFPDGKSTGPSTKSVTLIPTDAGREYASRLMLLSGKYKGDYTIYKTDKLKDWIKEFKGLYIRPAEQNTVRGTVFNTVLDASGVALYGRNRQKDDPTLIKDTLALAYFFYDSQTAVGNISVNTIKHDYAQASSPLRIIPEDAAESNKNRPLNAHVMVEGLSGVVTEITFSREFFDELEEIVTSESKDDKVTYTTFAVNQAMMKIYFSNSDYNWEQITNPLDLTRYMNASLSRLGLYTNYKKKTNIVDYNYVYESYYSTELAYDGYINRSQGCYQMNISSYIQELWNSYLAQKKLTPAGQPVDLSKIDKRVIYLAPQASEIFGGGKSVLQGMNDGTNHAPIKLDLTYTMIK